MAIPAAGKWLQVHGKSLPLESVAPAAKRIGWEVWLQVAKRIGIPAGRRFHVVFGMVREVWLQVARRIGISGRSSFSRRVWDGNVLPLGSVAAGG